eukprot:c9390_g1_i1.p1 GENE.c9390_g1_i1~~c9390_g1_i1.p1  ORF type:complete len:329 (-),score=148.49 c9390_g1_i1:5-961(-)
MDWLKLNNIVHDFGGVDNVTKANLWEQVVTHLGVEMSATELKKIYEEQNPQQATEEIVADEYEVERIVSQEKRGRHYFFLVKWKGFPETDNSWEPEENLTNCIEKIKQFKLDMQKKKPAKDLKRTSSAIEDENEQSEEEYLDPKNIPMLDANANFDSEVAESVVGVTRAEDGVGIDVFVKWKGFPETDNSWEPEENLTNCIEKIKQFKLDMQKKKPAKDLKRTSSAIEDENEQSEEEYLDPKNIPMLDANANFDSEVAESVVGVTRAEDGVGIDVLVKWKGFPERYTWVSAKECRKRIPYLLLDFYEARVKFISPAGK